MGNSPTPSGTAVSAPVVRCAEFHLAAAADPVGSAGAYDAFLLVEVPLPWGHDISEHEPFASLGAGSVLTAPDGRRWRPQGLVPRGDTAGAVRVLAMDQAERPAATPYRRREWWVPRERVAELCGALLTDDRAALAGFDDAAVEVPDEVVDLLVCTHGRRDVCCGGSGTRLHEDLADALLGDRHVRLWRVSHTGGHKFAPTALTFPDGYAWAHLDLAGALAVARRDAVVGPVAAHCRGVASLPPAAQVADRELLSRVGWDWCSAHRVVEVAERGGPRRRHDVRVDAALPDDRRIRAMVGVEVEREIPQPTCGDPVGAPAPTSPVWRATRVDPIPAQ